jgi:hypothetical protein
MAEISWFRTSAPDGMSFAADRLYLKSAIRKRSTEASRIADLLASSLERKFIEMALRNRRISRGYIALRSEAMKYNKGTLSAQLDELLLKNKRKENHPAIERLRNRSLCHREVSSHGSLLPMTSKK